MAHSCAPGTGLGSGGSVLEDKAALLLICTDNIDRNGADSLRPFLLLAGGHCMKLGREPGAPKGEGIYW